ncbi:hypothetical protein KIN20_010244 [Parelaphostrongylus tenuis]|uniref:Uncharacterized protein n=1 Tax=Parelaphostrongylus tenuis TaxID=148309 RepID=A0AAD5QLR1_PARTN|nr:hypothetical protein KIN20_010244 [Parelaphostrongylus tenuis]
MGLLSCLWLAFLQIRLLQSRAIYLTTPCQGYYLLNCAVMLLLVKAFRATMAKARAHSLLLFALAICAVFGCSTILSGQGSTADFKVIGFTLPVAMVFSTKPYVPIRVPGISTDKDLAKKFVNNQIKNAVSDVLDQQGRGALLSGAVISSILSDLVVSVNYEPLECKEVLYEPRSENSTGITLVPEEYLVISGSLKTTNLIMASWDKKQWKSVLDKAVSNAVIGDDLTKLYFYESNWRKACSQTVEKYMSGG